VRGPLATLLLVGLLLAGAGGAGAQAAGSPAEPAAAEARFPDAFELAARGRLVADSAVRAEREIEALARTEDLGAELEGARRRQAELRELLATVAQAEYVRPERISRVGDQALLNAQRLEDLRERAAGRVAELTRVRAEWTERQRFWLAWRDALRAEPEFAGVQPQVRAALERIGAVLRQVAERTPELLSLQQEIEALQASTDQIAGQVAAIRTGRREALLRRDEPVLFGPAFLEEVRAEPVREWRPAVGLHAAELARFLPGRLGTVLFHLVLVLVLALVARRVRLLARPDDPWTGLLRHPWALGIFGSATILAQRLGVAPLLWDVGVWAVVAASGAVLASQLFPVASLRRLVYFVAAFYPLFLLAEALRLPAPVFRIGVAGAAVAGLALCAGLAWWSGRSRAEPEYARLTLVLGAALWTVVLVAETLGYFLLARWVIHATITSAMVVFGVAFLVVLARGAIRTLLRSEATERRRFLRRFGIPLAERLLFVFQAVLVVGAALAVLDIWEVAPSPLATWTLVVGAGFTVAGLQITVGRVFFAALLLYLALVASWLARTLVQSEVYQRWEMDRGVGDSISTLVHYTLIAIGVLLALGAIGVELQNFAIVAGALGVGIGFGLQNVVNNFVSGLILLFERPVRVGDTVVIGGEWGTVTKIGLRSTIVLTFDQAELIVPNGDLVSEKVVNWTLSNPRARVILPVGVAYGSDIQQVLRLLREAAPVHPAVLDDPAPTALFMRFGDSSLDFELRVWVRQIQARLEVQSMVLAEVDRVFREAGIEIPFPQRDLHLRSVEPSLVRTALGGAGGDGRAAADAATERQGPAPPGR
jgi:potassium-dependent mechanosensitive channel